MTSYAPVTVTGSALQGPQQQQPPEGARFNGTGGVRRGWWWQAGPVDSCCFCCSLSTGVALMAVDCLCSGIWALFFGRAYQASDIGTSLAFSQGEYARGCEGPAASTTSCEQLKESIARTEALLDVLQHYPVAAYVQAVLSIVAGVFGIWAVLFKNTRAAKVYMLTWPAKILAMVWAALALHSLYATYDVEEGPVGIVYLVTLFGLLYYFKVAWSYYKRRLEYSYDAPPSGRGASSDPACDATPMLAMSTNV